MTTIDDKTRATAMLISSVLFRAALVGFVLLLITCIPILFLTDQMHAIHSSMIEMEPAEHRVLMFTWLGNMKILLIVLLLLPAIGIRWALKKAR
tara:strand:- start:57 stop:338 length:282 start_codon:yes stop_codon:yes gene_type:complete